LKKENTFEKKDQKTISGELKDINKYNSINRSLEFTKLGDTSYEISKNE
jgi:hypothetical protein